MAIPDGGEPIQVELSKTSSRGSTCMIRKAAEAYGSYFYQR